MMRDALIVTVGAFLVLSTIAVIERRDHVRAQLVASLVASVLLGAVLVVLSLALRALRHG